MESDKSVNEICLIVVLELQLLYYEKRGDRETVSGDLEMWRVKKVLMKSV